MRRSSRSIRDALLRRGEISGIDATSPMRYALTRSCPALPKYRRSESEAGS
jgi:hypothetical protein